MRTNARGTLTALALIATTLGCERPNCGEDLDYDYAMDRCVCTAPRVWSGDFCIEAPDAGGGDAAVDPDGPSAPEIAIDPATPVTLDDLTVNIVTESIDPLGEPITYEYAWRRDGELVSDLVDPRVESERTAKHQRWEVQVTPLGSGGRRGPAATTAVVIANSPPRLTTIGLSDYRPIVGDRLHVLSGTPHDDDGDTVGIRFEWSIQDEVVSGETAAHLTLSAERTSGGDSIRAIATPSDGETTGASLTTGAALAVADVTRWRALAPNLTFDGHHFVAYDEGHERFLLFGRVDGVRDRSPALWEIVLAGDIPRFVALHPGEGGPDHRAAAVDYDPLNQRVLVFGGQSRQAGRPFSNTLWALDVSLRGEESWSEIPIVGDAPSPRLAASSAFDVANGYFIIAGGVTAGGQLSDEVWALDVRTIGDEAWTLLGHLSAPVLRPAIALDSVRNRLLIFGGLEGASVGSMTPSTRVRARDLSLPDGEFIDSGSDLALASIHAFAHIDGAADEVVLFGGLEPTGSTPSLDVLRVSLGDLSSRRVTSSGPGTTGGPGAVVRRRDGTLLAWPRQIAADGIDTLRFDEFDPSTGAWRQVFVPGVHAPIVNEGASRGTEFVAGRTALDDEASDQDTLWELVSPPTWRTSVLMPDLLTDRRPGARTGVARGSGSEQLWVIGGDARTGALSPLVPWSLGPSSAQWIEHTLNPTSPMPAPRRGAALLDTGCGTTRVGIFGGETGGGALLDDVWVLECAIADERDCHWVAGNESGRPSARAGAAAVVPSAESTVLLFGGRTATGASSDIFRFESCGAAPWTRVTPTGPSPAGRADHSMTATQVDSIGVVVFGGSDGSTFYDDAHRLVGSGTTWRWSAIVVPSDANRPLGRGDHVATWDDFGSRLIVYGGTRDQTFLSDLWELRIR